VEPTTLLKATAPEGIDSSSSEEEEIEDKVKDGDEEESEGDDENEKGSKDEDGGNSGSDAEDKGEEGDVEKNGAFFKIILWYYIYTLTIYKDDAGDAENKMDEEGPVTPNHSAFFMAGIISYVHDL